MLSDVHAYWLSKRKKHARPLMRRLWAPTPASDQNPYNVFRLRERANRPATRRRRENSAECLEKLRTMRDNLLHALEVGWDCVCLPVSHGRYLGAREDAEWMQWHRGLQRAERSIVIIIITHCSPHLLDMHDGSTCSACASW